MFFTTFVWKNVLLRSIQLDIINLHMSSPKYSLLLSDFSQSWIFLTDFRKILRYQISWKSVQWEPSCFIWTDGQADRHDEAYRSIANGPERLKEQRIWRQAVNWDCLLTHEFCLISHASLMPRPSCPLFDNILRGNKFMKIPIMQFFL
jgi:hypothetical protein